MSEPDAPLLMPEVEAALGGPDQARIELFAQAWRAVIRDGPFRWEMTHDEKIEARNRFFEAYEEGSEADKVHMGEMLLFTSFVMNEHLGPRPRYMATRADGPLSITTRRIREIWDRLLIWWRNHPLHRD